MARSTRLTEALVGLYDESELAWLKEVLETMGPAAAQPSSAAGGGPGEAALIAYADSLIDPKSDASPLSAARAFARRFLLADDLGALHLLPFCPWDTDRGFSVLDYRGVSPEYGDWEDVAELGRDFDLMFDFVANHASIDNRLVQASLIARHGGPPLPREAPAALAFEEGAAPSPEELRNLARPRATPPLTLYNVHKPAKGPPRAALGRAPEGTKQLGGGLTWTTFSRPRNADGSEATRQVDLDYRHPGTLLEALRILLFYADHGARLIRLDAVGYLWKKLGSTSLHEPETHRLVRFLCDSLRALRPGVRTVAEVNEPQESVLPYLGATGAPEADIVYQFTHFPLALHALLTGDARWYSDWLETLAPFGGRQFVTALGSHDGLGLKPLRGHLPDAESARLAEALVEERGGLPNYATLPGGEQIIYEVCGTAWALVNGGAEEEPLRRRVDRYLAVAAMSLLPRGIPAFYLHALVAAENHLPPEGLDESRSINRASLDVSVLGARLDRPDSRASLVLKGVRRLLRARRSEPAFDPAAPPLRPLESGCTGVLAVHLPAADSSRDLLALIDVSGAPQAAHCSLPQSFSDVTLSDRLSGERFPAGAGRIPLAPYQVRWLTREPAAQGVARGRLPQ